MFKKIIFFFDGLLYGSLRRRFVTLALLPLVVGFPVLVLMLLGWGGAAFERLLVFKVRSDLAVASGYFERVRDDVARNVEAFAASEAVAKALRVTQGHHSAATHGHGWQLLLQERAKTLGLDFLLLVDANRRIVASSLPDTDLRQRYPGWPVVNQALAGRGRVELDVFSSERLAALSHKLKERASQPVVVTMQAKADGPPYEGRGLMIHAAAPLHGQRLVLVGGMLLNRNLAFIDRINDMVYPEGSLPAQSRGTTTLFLDDVRIATNVPFSAGERALGTRVSTSVAEQVLGRGETWLNRAFVVNDWYVSGYQPLEDSYGARVGMLYVGFLEHPFVMAKWFALAVLVLLFALTMAGAAWVSWRFTRAVVRPVERMRSTMDAVAEGTLEARVGALAGPDELGELAVHFDGLLDRLQAQNQALSNWAYELDLKVDERTRELATANATLLRAQEQLAKSEKLAAIGQLAAGIAHEVNNPMAVIQGNLELMREFLGEAAQPVETEMRLIQEQVQRIRLIVAKLLQYARPSEYSGYVDEVDPAQVFQDSLLLVGHQVYKHHVAVTQEWQATQFLLISRYELQQVLINLILNALQAMPDGGVLSLTTRDAPNAQQQPGVLLSVGDTGAGVAADDLQRLFDPFFTRKSSGNGLGLWVCQGIVERFGGDIQVRNRDEGGAEFAVWLPCAHPEAQDFPV